MDKSEARKGMKVIFGRGRGEQSLGEIKRVNEKKATVVLLESRGNGRGSEAGSEWGVPYSMMRPATESEIKAGTGNGAPPAAQSQRSNADTPINYNPFQSADDVYILQAINQVYRQLEPEWLTADGERPRAQIQQLYNEYQRKLRGLFAALGREVSETVAFNWSQQKEQADKERRAKVNA